MTLLEEVQQKIKEIDTDERYHYPTATIDINAPLALIQLVMETQMKLLRWVESKLLE